MKQKKKKNQKMAKRHAKRQAALLSVRDRGRYKRAGGAGSEAAEGGINYLVKSKDH